MCDETQLLQAMKTCIIGGMESMEHYKGDSHLEIPRNFLLRIPTFSDYLAPLVTGTKSEE